MQGDTADAGVLGLERLRLEQRGSLDVHLFAVPSHLTGRDAIGLDNVIKAPAVVLVGVGLRLLQVLGRLGTVGEVALVEGAEPGLETRLI